MLNNVSTPTRETKFKTQRKMFPASNIHYIKHYDIGYSNLPLERATEYQIRYPAIRNAPKVNQAEECIPYEQNCEEENMSQEAKLIEEQMNKAKLKKQLDDYIEKANLAKRNHSYEPKFNEKEEAYSDSTSNQPKVGTDLVYDQVNDSSKPKDHVDKSNIEENNAVMNSPSNDSVWYAASSNLKSEDMERRMRIKKYKEYLDMQVKLKNEKLQYERSNKIESNKLMQLRSSELKRMEQENLVKDRIFKDRLAEVYKRQIAERNTLRKGLSMNPNELNNFCGLMDINRKRYLKVDLFLLVEIG